jgi:uncharacterized RDD family membrane protein YckC
MNEIIDDNIINEHTETELVQASTTKRFTNFVIDRIFTFGLSMALYMILPQGTIDAIAENRIIDTVISSVLYGLLMGIIEGLTRGYSLGKWITGTIAINDDGSKLGFSQAMLRGVCRIIPFEPFSAFGQDCYPWHDSLSKTYVIDKALSNYP